jgi:DNA-binding NarL/FixJ family response regulator
MWSRPHIPDVVHPVTGGMAALTEHQREIVRLRCVEELTMEEVGEKLNRSPQTIKNITTVVLRKLGKRSMHGVCYDLCCDEYQPVDAMRADVV